jgi:hypothetical protein
MSKNAGSKAAAASRADEEARQARIREGTAAINRTFDGTTTGSGAVGADAAFDPSATYVRADGSRWTPPAASAPAVGGVPGAAGKLTGLFGTPGAADPSEAFRREAAAGGLFTGTQRSGGFDDNFFTGIRDSFTNFARPQLDDQMNEARKQLTFALARSGTLDSSTRGEQSADLQKKYDINLQDITDKARQFENDQRNSVEGARADLISTLQATGDAQGASQAALARAKTLSATPAYSPLGQLFQDSTAMLNQQAALERSYSLGFGNRPRFNTGVFGAPSSAVKVG